MVELHRLRGNFWEKDLKLKNNNVPPPSHGNKMNFESTHSSSIRIQLDKHKIDNSRNK